MDAIVSGSANVALLIDGDLSWSLKRTTTGIERVPRSHDLDYIFGDASDLAYFENTSEAAIVHELGIAHAGVKVLHLALMLCDPETSAQAARLGGIEMEAVLARSEAAERAERILDANPMPKPLEVAIAMERCHTHRLRRAIPFFEELEARQPVIAEVRRAWDLLPSSLFTDAEERAFADGLLAREGAFRSLVRARRDGGNMSRWIESTVRLLSARYRRVERWLSAWVEGLGTVGARPGAAAQAYPGDPTRPFRQRLHLEGIIGHSAALARIFEQVEAYAPLDVALLITGPNGTGKTQLAHAIHANSHRRNGPFVELRCGAVPENLIESVLFGTTPGAYSGSRRGASKIEAAEGGTLFLDEIADIPPVAQAKLLQLLSSRQYYPLGSNKLATANIRLIATTNVDLKARIAAKQFREDLLSVIDDVNIRMPALSERSEDIAMLVDELLIRIAGSHNLAPLPVSEQARRVMARHDWPGNVRELCNGLEAALVRASSEGASQIEPRHLFREATRSFQRELLRRELVELDWSIAAVAKRLALSRQHVYRLIHQLGLRQEDE